MTYHIVDEPSLWLKFWIQSKDITFTLQNRITLIHWFAYEEFINIESLVYANVLEYEEHDEYSFSFHFCI